MSKFTSFSTSFTGIRGRAIPIGEFIYAAGGILTANATHRTHLFTSSGTLEIKRIGYNATLGNKVEILVVAGGGGGAGNGDYGGGGGGGGVIYHSGYTIPVATNYQIIVGNGGTAGASGTNTVGTAGGNSTVILTTTSTTLFNAIGGGPGSPRAPIGSTGVAGGSGGGSGPTATYTTNQNQGGITNQGTLGTNPAGSTYYGNNGGNGWGYNWSSGGAGGGAGAAGGDTHPGIGILISSFSSYGDPLNLGYFASGGGAAWDNQAGIGIGTPVAGGGGGFTVTGTTGGTAGKDNTGGGGATGANGGSGVVIVRYKFN